jgi:hypothetical protein
LEISEQRQIAQDPLRRAFAPTFAAGEMMLFIPWCVVAAESCRGGALLLDLRGPPISF